MKILILLFMILILSGLFIISNNNLYMSESDNVNKFLILYEDWLNKFYLNVQILTGNVISLDWSPE